MAVPPVTSNNLNGTTTTPSSATTLSSSDFLNLMITQLQQQDPLNPTDSNQLLTQMSQISNLQSNTQMQTSLQALTLQQSIAAGGNLIGKTVMGVDDNGQKQTGVVTSVVVQAKNVYLQLDSGSQVAMTNVTNVAALPSSTVNGLAQMLNATGSTGSITSMIANPQLASFLSNGTGGFANALSFLSALGAK